MASDIHAMQLRQERMDGEIKLLASTVAQSTQATTSAMQSMSSDIKQMASDVRGMAPHAADIGRLYKSIEAQNAAMLSMADRMSRMENKQSKWSGGLVVITMLGGTILGVLNENVNGKIKLVAESVATIGQTHITRLDKLERRLERLEGMN